VVVFVELQAAIRAANPIAVIDFSVLFIGHSSVLVTALRGLPGSIVTLGAVARESAFRFANSAARDSWNGPTYGNL
jgi:hypothetical protein